MNKPFVIVGAGLMGSALAYYLSSHGKQVMLIDDERVGRASGWNPGGINPLHGPGFPDTMREVYHEAYNLHVLENPKIMALSGIDFKQKVVSRIFLAKNSSEMIELEKVSRFYNELDGFSANLYEGKRLLGLDQRINPNFSGGLLTQGNMRIDSERYRLALISSSRQSGARVISGTLTQIINNNQVITEVKIGDQRIPVSGFCMATGAWATEIINGWNPGFNIPIRSVIGDLLFIQSLDKPLKLDIGYGIQAIYQHDTNHYWVGGTTRDSGFLGGCPSTVKQELLLGLKNLLPDWNSFRVIGQSSAARPVSLNGLPILGKTPAYSNGWIMNGGGSKGVLLCLWMAKTLADFIIKDSIAKKMHLFLPKSNI